KARFGEVMVLMTIGLPSRLPNTDRTSGVGRAPGAPYQSPPAPPSTHRRKSLSDSPVPGRAPARSSPQLLPVQTGKLLSVLCLLLTRDEFLVIAHLSPLSWGRVLYTPILFAPDCQIGPSVLTRWPCAGSTLLLL